VLIAHRCINCAHPDYRRGLVDASGDRGPCACGHKCTASQLSRPQVMPTFDAAGRKVERIVAPGEPIGAGVDNGLGHTDGIGFRTCDCEGCKALYARLTRLGPDAVPDVAEEPPGTAQPSPRQLRKWANENGVDCPPTGRVPQRVREAYAAAHN
jgi:hypothetical protein